MSKDLINLKRRFVKDFNLPINLIELFGYYENYYDFFPKEDYMNLLKLIEKEYSGNINLWLDHYAQLRDKIITTIEKSDSFQNFNNFNMSGFTNAEKHIKEIPDSNIYNEENVGKYFLSIDLKKANFQALKYFDKDIVLGADTYDELIGKFGGDDYFKKSKYTRQVIFGKLNPKKTIQLEKFLIRSIYNSTLNEIRFLNENEKLVTLKSDELVYCVKESDVETIDKMSKKIEENIKAQFNLNINVTLFKMGYIECVNHNGNKVNGFIKKYVTEGKKDELKDVSAIFYPQVYAFFKGVENVEQNRYFRAEDQIAFFTFPLELVKMTY